MSKWQPERNDNLLSNLPKYQLYGNLYQGISALKYPSTDTYDPNSPSLVKLQNGTYLQPFANETSTSFQERLQRASCPNFCDFGIKVFSSTLFSQKSRFERNQISEALGEDISKSIDNPTGAGSDISVFIRDAFNEALIYGWVGIFTDFPRVGKNQFRTKAEEDAAKLRPYSRIILPMSLWDWQIDPITRKFSYLLIHEGYHAYYEQEVWSVWTPETWLISDENGNILDSGEHSFGDQLPFNLMLCDKSSADKDNEPFGHSLLKNVAFTQLELFNLESQIEDILRKANFPIPHFKAPTDQLKSLGTAGDIPIGPENALYGDIDFEWHSPDSDSIKTSLERRKVLINDISFTLGIDNEMMKSTEAQSGVALSHVFTTRYDLIKLCSSNCEAAEVSLYKTYSRILERDLPVDSVLYPDDFATGSLEADQALLESLHRVEAHPGFIKEVESAMALKRFSHRSDVDELRAAITAEPQSAPETPEEPEATSAPSEAPTAPEPPSEPDGLDLDTASKVFELMVKAGAPDAVTQSLAREILAATGISSDSALGSLTGANFRWYTAPIPEEESNDSDTTDI